MKRKKRNEEEEEEEEGREREIGLLHLRMSLLTKPNGHAPQHPPGMNSTTTTTTTLAAATAAAVSGAAVGSEKAQLLAQIAREQELAAQLQTILRSPSLSSSSSSSSSSSAPATTAAAAASTTVPVTGGQDLQKGQEQVLAKEIEGILQGSAVASLTVNVLVQTFLRQHSLDPSPDRPAFPVLLKAFEATLAARMYHSSPSLSPSSLLPMSHLPFPPASCGPLEICLRYQVWTKVASTGCFYQKSEILFSPSFFSLEAFSRGPHNCVLWYLPASQSSIPDV